MIKLLFFVFWFFVPAGVANIGAFFSGKIPFIKQFKTPVDMGLKFRKKRLLGDNKTVRGFICGIVLSILAVYLQLYLYQHISFIKSSMLFNYNTINPIIFGALSGFGALFGDSVKSYFKRQLNIPPGGSWFPFDQVDYIFGGIFFISFYVRLGYLEYIALFLMWFLLHPLTTLIGYLLKLKESPL
jgi:CDP-2,3-bis-(O-geranylgeranyl)-sn-glycerol synthase